MSKVFSALAVSVDGYISGRTPEGGEEYGRGLGDAPMLFDWYFNGDTPSTSVDGFKVDKAAAEFFDALAARPGAVIVGRTTYDHSSSVGGGSPHQYAPLVLLSDRPVPELSERQTLVTTGIEDAVATAKTIAGDKDVCLMGGGVVTAALAAGLVDELVLHQVPILLGGGRRYFQELPAHIRLRVKQVVATPGATHLHYEVAR